MVLFLFSAECSHNAVTVADDGNGGSVNISFPQQTVAPAPASDRSLNPFSLGLAATVNADFARKPSGFPECGSRSEATLA